jgi:hypothetical protein
LVENKRELVADLVLKAKQIELLIESLPPPEPEEAQVRDVCGSVTMPLTLSTGDEVWIIRTGDAKDKRRVPSCCGKS